MSFMLLGLASAHAAMWCSGSCTANCDSWDLHYSVDCDCNITTYESWHWTGTDYEYRDHHSNPEFVGMDASALGCSCDPCATS